TTRIIKAEREEVLMVPEQALRFLPEGARPGRGAGAARAARSAGWDDAGRRPGRLWMLRDGKPAAVPLRIGLDDGTSAEVVSGEVREGDRVILAEPTPEPTGRTVAHGAR